jgi:hypothetical protein
MTRTPFLLDNEMNQSTKSRKLNLTVRELQQSSLTEKDSTVNKRYLKMAVGVNKHFI